MGTSQAWQSARGLCRDHPHACGDKVSLISAKLSRIGSSPRVWGQVSGDIPSDIVYGIIPTRVGTSRDRGA